jgi:ABC-type glutathione transport system ATPase component
MTPACPAQGATSDESALVNDALSPEAPDLVPVARLAMSGITKAFPGVQALRDVSFEVLPGEIHALIGENGAGKSTLMNILAGVHRPDNGTIAIDGQVVEVTSEAVASGLGIAMVHQEQSLVPRLSIAENIFGSRPPLKQSRSSSVSVCPSLPIEPSTRSRWRRLRWSRSPRRSSAPFGF